MLCWSGSQSTLAMGSGGWQKRLPCPPLEFAKGFVLAVVAWVVVLAVVAGRLMCS
jgi:hypothetical protein